jgi:hypothetical protein
MNAEEPAPSALLAAGYIDMVGGSWMAQAACVAAELGLADLLAAGPMTSEQLAAATATHSASLARLLQALCTIGICRSRDDGSWEITPLGTCLQSDSPHSLRYWTLWWGQHLWHLWGHLSYSVRTGISARKMLLGTEGFEHLRQDPQAAAIFHRAAAELTRLTAEQIVRAYDFSRLPCVADIGGGCGELLARIL